MVRNLTSFTFLLLFVVLFCLLGCKKYSGFGGPIEPDFAKQIDGRWFWETDDGISIYRLEFHFNWIALNTVSVKLYDSMVFKEGYNDNTPNVDGVVNNQDFTGSGDAGVLHIDSDGRFKEVFNCLIHRKLEMDGSQTQEINLGYLKLVPLGENVLNVMSSDSGSQKLVLQLHRM